MTEVAITLFGRVVDKTTILIATIMEATALVAATEVAIVVVAITMVAKASFNLAT